MDRSFSERVRLHGLWVDSDGVEGVRLVAIGEQLSKLTLDGLDLRRAVFDKADMNLTALAGANLAGASFKGADLSGAWMSGSCLVNANLDQAILKKTELDDADLTGASLHNADMIKTSLHGATLRRARLTRTWLVHTYLMEADLTEADLGEADLHRTFISHATFGQNHVTGALGTIGDPKVLPILIDQGERRQVSATELAEWFNRNGAQIGVLPPKITDPNQPSAPPWRWEKGAGWWLSIDDL